MIYTIKNNKIIVSINSLGAELMSIKDLNGKEYLWQGDKKYWSDRAPILFPYIARLTNNSYFLDEKCYSMKIHGFANYNEFSLYHITDNEITFCLNSNEDTYKCYPRVFSFFVTYRLIESKLEITFKVLNKDDKTMYFGIGGHPGFLLDGNYNDYYLEFNEKCKPIRVGFNEKCFLNGLDKNFPLIDDLILKLDHKMFDDDAIVLYDNAKSVSIKSCKTNYKLTVSFPDMKYLGLWHRPKTDAPYICIEPWSSLPSREGVVEEFEKQVNLIKVYNDSSYVNSWSVEIESERYLSNILKIIS